MVSHFHNIRSVEKRGLAQSSLIICFFLHFSRSYPLWKVFLECKKIEGKSYSTVGLNTNQRFFFEFSPLRSSAKCSFQAVGPECGRIVFVRDSKVSRGLSALILIQIRFDLDNKLVNNAACFCYFFLDHSKMGLGKRKRPYEFNKWLN